MDYKEIVSHFATEGDVSDIRPLGKGHINDSHMVITSPETAPDYVLQRINHDIFRDVDMLQGNILAVTSHIRSKLTARGEDDIDRKVLEFIPAREGRPYYHDGENYWRMMKFIPGSVSYDTITPGYARCAGEAFGEFQQMLSDIPVRLGETIPSFHDMEFRLGQLREAIAEDRAGRVAQTRELITELEKRADDMCLAERLYREGKLPKRVCHCDTKVNNMLFDREGNVLCVVDLDTVMPGFIFSDYGDFIRTGANTGAEDDPDLSKVGLDIPIFEAFTEGYLKGAGPFLTPVEIENLPYAAARFAYMQAVRFLWDYLGGDTYYKTAYPEHNLVRTRAQFKLLQSIEENTPYMREFIRGLVQ